MAANDKEVLVKADHVKVYFKGKKRGQTVKAVDDVSFEVQLSFHFRRHHLSVLDHHGYYRPFCGTL